MHLGRGRAPAVLLVATLACLGSGLATGGAAASPAADAAGAGGGYLVARQHKNGAFFSANAAGDAMGEALLAAVAGGVAGEPIARALAYLSATGPAGASRGAYAARIIVGLVAAGQNPRSFGGYDYVARLKSFYNPATGAYDNGVYSNAVAVLGLLSAGEQPASRTVNYIEAQQCADGGFGHDALCTSRADTDTTAMVAAALAGAGAAAKGAARSKSREWLLAHRNASGGWGLYPGDPDNANSTGLVLSLLVQVDEDPHAPPWRVENADPVSALLDLRDPASGGFRWVGTDRAPNDYATVQALPGLAGRSWLVTPPPSGRPRPAATPAARTSSPATTPSLSHRTAFTTTTVTVTGTEAVGGEAAIQGRAGVLSNEPGEPARGRVSALLAAVAALLLAANGTALLHRRRRNP